MFSSAMIGMYVRVLASMTFLSRIVITVQSKRNLSKYKATIKAFESYSSVSHAAVTQDEMFAFVVVFACLIIILPINVFRLYYLYYYESRHDDSVLVYYLFAYIQNLSMCCVETQFVAQCHVVYTKFREINDELDVLRVEHTNRTKYPFIVAAKGLSLGSDKSPVARGKSQSDCVPHRSANRSTADTVETLRIKYWLARQAVDMLNHLFGIQMGLSVFLLWVMALFDIYYEIYRNSPSKLLVYGWLLQYSIRLIMIVLMAHYTTKQVCVCSGTYHRTPKRNYKNGNGVP